MKASLIRAAAGAALLTTSNALALSPNTAYEFCSISKSASTNPIRRSYGYIARGYMLAVYDQLLASKRICDPPKDTGDPSLGSAGDGSIQCEIYRGYVIQHGAPGDYAFPHVEKALIEAYPCKGGAK